jgi:mycothiol synthase
VAWPAGITVSSATRDGLDEVVALLRSAEQVDLGEAAVTREDMASHWNVRGFDLVADSRMLHDGGLLVAYAEVFGGRIWGTVAPHARGRGLGTAVLRWQEQRAREQARELGLPPGRIAQTVSAAAQTSIALLQAHGFESLYVAWALRLPPEVDLSGAQLPDDVRIRTLLPGDERAVYEVIERGFREWPHRPPQSYDGWRVYTVDRADYDSALTFVASTPDGEIVGAVYGIHYPDSGWAQQLAVVAEHRRRGIGSALLAALFGELRRRGETRLGLGTDSRTGALGLYTRLGMEVERTFQSWSKRLG